MLRNLCVVLTFALCGFLFAGTITYDDSLGPQGFSLSESSNSGVTLIHSINHFTITEDDSKNTIQLPGSFLPNDAGAPDIPGAARNIAIPQYSTAKYTILYSRMETFQNIELAPAPVIPLESDDSPLIYQENEEIYSENAFYPISPVTLSEPKKIRGLDVVTLGVMPFQYNPVTKELKVYRDLSIEITFEGGNGHFGEDRLRNRHWDRILRNAVINYSVLDDIDYFFQSKAETSGYEYIIICPDDPIFESYANQLKDFRTKQGVKTCVVTISQIGGNTEEAIERYVNNAYNYWTIPPSAVLMLGDCGTSGSSGTLFAPTFEYKSSCVSDNFYADVDNDEQGLPDITFARMTAQNETHLQTMISKIINYESYPPTNSNFYNKPITACGWQTDRWFQIYSETVGGYMKNVMGKSPLRINSVYSGDPTQGIWSSAQNTKQVIDYFGPYGRKYIPSDPNVLGDFNMGSGSALDSLLDGIDEGAFIVQHRDHGLVDCWVKPTFSTYTMNYLKNKDLTFVFSINCATGQFSYSGTCFAEKFHRYTYNNQNSGAVGILAAERSTPSYYNDIYGWGVFDYLWPDFMPDYGAPATNNDEFMPAFASVSGKYFLDYSRWLLDDTDNSMKKAVNYLYHLHGDPYLNIYTEVPQELTVDYHEIYEGQNRFTIETEPGAYISLVKVDGSEMEIIGRGESNGYTSIRLEPQSAGTEITLTITKQNYFRYETKLTVASAKASYADKYAVIIAGDYNAENIPTEKKWNNGVGDCSEFWNDLFLQWEILYKTGYKKENIYVVFADGTDQWYLDQNINNRYRPYFVTGSIDETITNFSATRENLETISEILQTRMKSDSFLYVWAMSHGGSSTQSSLCLIDPANPNSYDEITDVEFADLFKDLPANKIAYNISANYAQGFISALKADNALVQVSSTNTKSFRSDDKDKDGSYIPFLENEEINGRIYYHGETNFLNYISVAGRKPLGQNNYNGILLSGCDTDEDGYISILESYNWLHAHESTDQTATIDNVAYSGEHTSYEYPTLIHNDYYNYNSFLKGIMAIPVSFTIDQADLDLFQNSEITVLANNQVDVTEGYNFIVRQGATIKLSEGSELRPIAGGNLVFDTGSSMIAEGNSRIIGNTQIEDAVNIDILENTDLALQQMELSLLEGTSLKLAKNSKLIIENGTNLTIQEGIIQLSEGAEIIVKNKGILNAEGITFSYTGTDGNNWLGINCEPGSTLIFNDVEIAFAETAVSGSPIECTITNSTFENCENGISLVNCDNYSITSNTFNGSSAGTGVSLAVSDGTFQNNSIDNFHTGIRFTSCSPVISKNVISNNTRFGIYVFGHNAYPQLVLGSKEATSINNTLINNGTNTVYTSPFSFPDAQIGIMPFGNIYLEGGMNNIYTTEYPGLMPCISVSPKYISDPSVIIEDSEVFIAAAENYWGEHLYDSCFKLVENYNIDFVPWADQPYTGEISNQTVLSSNEPPSTESILFSNAVFLEEKGNYKAAIKQYEHIIDKYVNTSEYYVSMTRLPNLYSESEISAEPLISTFDDALESDNTTHKKFFKEMKVATHIKGRNYPTAKLLAEEMKNEAVTEEEVLLADIDIAICDMMMVTEGKGGKSSIDYISKLNGLILNGNDDQKSEPTAIEDNLLPQEIKLYQNYPNPFNPITQIKFALPTAMDMKVNVYNSNGQKVANLYQGIKSAGIHTVEFDGSKFNSGVYYYTLEVEGKTLTQKMILMK